MDLQVGVIISIVFLVSFLSYLFISKFLPHGKTFDEMIAEKKRMREEMLGTFKPNSNKFKESGNNKKKSKKDVKKVNFIFITNLNSFHKSYNGFFKFKFFKLSNVFSTLNFISYFNEFFKLKLTVKIFKFHIYVIFTEGLATQSPT